MSARVWLAAAVAGVVLGIGTIASAAGTVAEIRVHGNHSIADDAVIALAGLEPGERYDAERSAAVLARLEASGRFASVELLERSRSLTVDGPLVLIIVVRERPSVASRLLWLPVVEYDEDWGLRAGARATLLETGGSSGRLSASGLVGGVRGLFTSYTRDVGPGLQLVFDARGSRREHPHFEVDLDRIAVGARLVRQIERWEVGAALGWEDVDLAGRAEDRLLRYGLDVAFDTRDAVTFPRDAYVLGAAWQGLGLDGAVRHRLNLTAAGYLGLVGQSVLAVETELDLANGALPDWERPTLGGAVLRGHPAGSFIGDQRARARAELRLPVTSPLTFARMGIHGFADVGRVADHTESAVSGHYQRGAGAGLFLHATVFQLQLDVASDLEGSTRLHLQGGVHF